MKALGAAFSLPKSPGHPFEAALNRLWAQNGFDVFPPLYSARSAVAEVHLADLSLAAAASLNVINFSWRDTLKTGFSRLARVPPNISRRPAPRCFPT